MAFGKKSEEDADISKAISKFKDLSKEGKIELISHFISELKKLHDVTEQEILGKKEACIPVGVFGSDSLSSLEAIVKYLREDLKIKFSRIGKMLNRSNKTIWATYHNAAKKMPSSFCLASSDVAIPVSALADRSYSTLESVVGFIKGLDYSNHEVALMLHLDDRTIWTVYDRVKKKRGVKA
ncbi:hypothetical protein HYX08_05665 [Candidatus Woesearchaeota archaeon]|nr:hypothetical protein [Candidatus Woesearchaeota archaeon]